ncbi:DUF4214 domain-containing protein [Chelatococcus asaccharovorans]|uniref:DUF4214 domain-containing protein n=1 Tax=Chelatococcus asaccharovorans TaxID=28210 RepID=UPI00224C704D|nr:DUF4214 domain-containing protein [Chelatococcus asaccharovorans]CAH1659431.1 conserved hypothetical protein [Chelatococcus asaccharovorans]CAH1684185.1 conserved hypothetical protein [Chelatococcus asaccharovorans]
MQENIVFNDETGSVSDEMRVQLEDSYKHALADWMARLPSPHPLDIKLTIVSSLERGRIAETEVAGLKTIAYRDNGAGVRLMPHAAYKAITGIDNQEDVADIDVRIPRRMVDALSFDGTFDVVHRYDATTLFRHEVAHALFMAAAPDPAKGNVTGWQSNVIEGDGVTTVFGAHARAFLPAGIPLANPVHLDPDVARRFGSALGAQLPQGVAVKISALDEALMSDSGLPTALNDRMVFGPWYHGEVDMGGGLDLAVIQAPGNQYRISHETDKITLASKIRYAAPGGDEGAFKPELTLHNVERIQFSNTLLAFDVDGHAGQAYRLSRTVYGEDQPDAVLARQLQALDQGKALRTLAGELVATDDFSARYGSAASGADLITRFYHGILGRAPDAAGAEFWRKCMAEGLGEDQLLFYFAESSEHKELTSPLLGIVLQVNMEEPMWQVG